MDLRKRFDWIEHPRLLVAFKLTTASIAATRHSTISKSPKVGVLLIWKSS